MSAFVHETAIVEAGATLDEGVKVWHHAHVREGASIGAHTVIGKNVFVDADVPIGAGCKIQNNVSVYAGVHLAARVFVGPSAVFTNDRNPRAFGEWEREDTYLEEGCSIGANAVLRCGITIGSFALVGAGAVVTTSVEPHQLVAGNPARPIGWVCVCGRRVDDRPTTGQPSCPVCVSAMMRDPSQETST
jgi:UDP-2-acetamido-3-amino-2,3-dideoxy-glucuronate N-acetyltransferase